MKTILITGAAGNLGKAVVKKFLDTGYRVIAATHSENTPGQDRLNLEVHVVDASDAGRVKEFIKTIAGKHSCIDGLIQLIGGFVPGRLDKTTGEDISKMIGLNFETAFHYVKPVMEQMKIQGGGKIILVGSNPGKNPKAARSSVAYALSKSLVFRLAEIVNEEGREKNIRASVFVPSTIDTPDNRKAMPDADFSKWNKPEEIADRMEKFISGIESSAIVEF